MAGDPGLFLLQGTKSALSSLRATPLGAMGAPPDEPCTVPCCAQPSGTGSLPGGMGTGHRSNMKSPAFYSYEDSNTRHLLTPCGRTQAWLLPGQ